MPRKPTIFSRVKSTVTKARALQIGDELYTIGINDGYIEIFQRG